MKKIHLIFILLLWSGIVSSQDYIDLIKLEYAITPANTFDTSSATTTLQEINGDLTLPLVVNDSFAFLTGIAYETIFASFNPGRDQEAITGLTLKLGANVKHNSKWSATYMLLPKISSDFKQLTNQDFQLGAAVLMKYTKTKNLNYQFGVYANTEQFGPFISPLFGLYYIDDAKKFEAKVLLPLRVDLNYSIAKNVRLGLNFKGQTRSYHLNTPLGNEDDRYVVKTSNDVYSYFQFGLNNGINFQLSAGRSVGRSYRMYDEQVSLAFPLATFGDDRTQLNTDFEDGWLFKATVFYRLNLTKDTDTE